MTDMDELADRFLKACHAKKILTATAESCTGGKIIALLTNIPGSSSMVDRGFVTYSNEAKVQMLGVDAAAIDAHGAVSAEVAGEMARGALSRSRADLAVSVTGIAGPGGGSAAKPVGLVHFGLARRPNGVVTVERRFGDLGRDAVRMASLDQALALLEEALGLT